MSLLKSLVSGVKSILSSPVTTAVAPLIPGIGMGIAAAATARQAYLAGQTPVASPQATIMPGLGQISQAGFMGLSPAAIGRGAAVLVKGARAIPRAAANLCRKYPTWCSTIGGTVAVEALFNSGQLPMPKRRRGRGITAHELRAFKRVARFTSKYCAPVHRAMRALAMRRGRSASCR